ncbi:MAG TPA: hypothetical protein VK821_16580 [Dehalococcoidia bacterium]|nr:hypothetical protein [Dehalococcoidia bacterium]
MQLHARIAEALEALYGAEADAHYVPAVVGAAIGESRAACHFEDSLTFYA